MYLRLRYSVLFSEIVELDSTSAIVSELNSPPTNTINSISITDDDVLDILLSFDVSKAAGPDDASAKLLKEAAPAIYISLTKLFNLSLKKDKFLCVWKKVNVIQLNTCNNYRPVSLLSCVGIKYLRK